MYARTSSLIPTQVSPARDKNRVNRLVCVFLVTVVLFCANATSSAFQVSREIQAEPQEPSLENRLASQPVQELAERVRKFGDAGRGSLVFHNPELTCLRCHDPDPNTGLRLGPALETVNQDATLAFLIDSILKPSQNITQGFQSKTIITVDGKQYMGLMVATKDTDTTTLVDPARNGEPIRIANDMIDEAIDNTVSAMPGGLVGALPDEQSFLDLVSYLAEIKRGGQAAVKRLRPPDSVLAVVPLAPYEASIDHRGMIRDFSRKSLERGQAIYAQHCARCHGTVDQEGSMPTAPRFGKTALKNGSDPYSMYQTLTHGYGLMVAQRWMVPQQKYDVVQYIRDEFLEDGDQPLRPLDAEFLASLPKGTERGPAAVRRTPWSEMNYGPFLFNTYQVGNNPNNIAYKGIAIRLDPGLGGVAKGREWILYEHDTMRVAAAWSGDQFIDYNGIHFNDRHNVHPGIHGNIRFFNEHLPGWANPETGTFGPDPRVVGRDGKRYGPLPASWLKYRGLVQSENQVVIQYTVGETDILESPRMRVLSQNEKPKQSGFVRHLNIGLRSKPMLMRVADVNGLQKMSAGPTGSIAFSNPNDNSEKSLFDGNSWLEADQKFEWRRDISIACRIKTDKDGTIVCQTKRDSEWVPGGTSLFVRNGRLVFDIGWVGTVTSRRRVDDNQWHTVGLVWRPNAEQVQLYIDQRLDVRGELEMGRRYRKPVFRIGFTASDFPESSPFKGSISNVAIWNKAIEARDFQSIDFTNSGKGNGMFPSTPAAHWELNANEKDAKEIASHTGVRNNLTWKSESGLSSGDSLKSLVATVSGLDNPDWQIVDGSLCLAIPAGRRPLKLAVQIVASDDPSEQLLERVANSSGQLKPINLGSLTHGGHSPYPQVLSSEIETMPQSERDAFAVDYLNHPADNPWSARMRLTGLDFVDSDTALICAWDGSVWKVTGFRRASVLKWHRVANGLFQPLGIRIVNGQVYVTCRDQLVLLKDLNGDDFFDSYQAFNSDHQVTEHFHEFAMGLQADDQGNFYYAKSARHALPALVPHHGTLIKVSSNGKESEILANGFRAANGVCLNPDGTFFVTDQEGHWTPKNRINWVSGKGNFYGNMMGYHQVEDDSDQAMEQPLCWITNRFDRSPGELMWVPKKNWGSLSGRLMNLSYGMGQVFMVPHEKIPVGSNTANAKTMMQGGMCALPIPEFPTGIMRGRFHPDGDLYCCGMYAWAGNQQQPGGLYRVRKTGQPAWLPIAITAQGDQIQIEFSDALSPSVAEPERFSIKTWTIRRSKNYGSPHLNEKTLKVTSVKLSDDRRTVTLAVPALKPTRCMEIECQLPAPDGFEVTRTIHNTIHSLSK